MEDQSLDIEITDEGFTEEQINAALNAQREAQEVQEEYNKQKEQRELEAEQAKKQALIQEEKDRPANLGDYAKDTVVGAVAGVQDTASSLITLPERIIDFFTGEMARENKEGGYKAEWDDWFVDDENPLETKTWWGGLVRGVTHVGTTLATPIPGAGKLGSIAKLASTAKAVKGAKAAKAVGAGLTVGKNAPKALKAARKARIAAHRLKVTPKFKFLGKTKQLTGRNLIKGAATGAKFDLTSKTSQEDNVTGMLKQRWAWLDTPLATQEHDHPAMKTLKNVVEGMALGVVFDNLIHIIGSGVKGSGKAIVKNSKGGEEVVDLKQVTDIRAESVRDQVAEKGIQQLELPGFGAYKNPKIKQQHQGNPTSLESLESATKSLDDIETRWGAEGGSAGSVTSNVEIDRIAKSSQEARKVVKEVLQRGVSEGYLKGLDETAARQGVPKEVYYAKVSKLAQQVYEGRNTSDFTPDEFWAQVNKESVKRTGSVEYEFVAAEMAPIIDTINGTLMKEIRDIGIGGREMQDIFDLRSVDGPAQQLIEKLIAGLRIRAIQKAEISQQFRELGDRATRDQIDEIVDQNVQQSIDAFRLAMKIAPEEGGDELFKTIFEGISMSKGIHTLDDFDAFMKYKLKGGVWKGGKKETGALIKELGSVFTHSVLSGPKTSMRAIMGTASATFARPMSMALGGLMKGDVVTMRAGLASLNAMRESIPESFELFKSRLNSYWSGDISTMKTRFIEKTKADDQWAMYGHWVENSGGASLMDKLVYRMANMARWANNTNMFTYSTKIMASTDDAFGLIIGRARAREKAFLEATEQMGEGGFKNFDAAFFKDAEDKFNAKIFDNDGNLTDEAAAYTKREATLTQDLSGFAKNLEGTFNDAPWARPFFLFARTGINGLTLTAKHTPGFNFLVKEWNDIAFTKPSANLEHLNKYGINNPRDLMTAKAVQQGRLAMGSAAIFMAGQSFLAGNLHGNGPTDRKKRQAWLDAGWKPRTVKIAGQWVSYDAFEPYNQILALVGDIGDHQELMGEEWAEDRFLKLSMALASTVTSKSYLAGLQSFVDLFSGAPGQQNRILASLMNNTIPLSSLRNEIGKVLNPHTKELGSDIMSSIRNRNLSTEFLAGEDELPTKFDILTGEPIKDWNFITRMFNAVSPVQFNLDYSPGRELIFNSGYDLRTLGYSAPDGTDLSDAPGVRSKFQKAMGDQNLLKKFEKLAADPRMQLSLAKMNEARKNGEYDLDPSLFPHVKRIQQIFKQAKKIAWAQISQDEDVMELIAKEKEYTKRKYNASQGTINEMINMRK